MLGIGAGLLLLAAHALAGASDHTYKNGEHVELWVNKVSPVVYRVKCKKFIFFDASLLFLNIMASATAGAI
jgi:hypothetical protein